MKAACILLPYIDFRYGVLPLREEGRITRLRRGVVCSEVAAWKDCAVGTNPSRLKDEPRRGFYKHMLFRCKATFKSVFRRAMNGLILCYRFLTRTDYHFTRKRCAMKGFCCYTIFL